MPNGMSEEAQSRGHAVWEGAPCKGALYPIDLELDTTGILSDCVSYLCVGGFTNSLSLSLTNHWRQFEKFYKYP